MLHMSAQEYQKMMHEQKRKPAKHHNKYVYVFQDGFIANEKGIDGHGEIIERYDSKKEYCRKKELELLERGGVISDLHWHVPILIQEGFINSEGKKQRPVTYEADFTYIQNGKRVVEDVKGIDKNTGMPRTTEAFRLKWKLLQAKYPEYIFKIS